MSILNIHIYDKNKENIKPSLVNNETDIWVDYRDYHKDWTYNYQIRLVKENVNSDDFLKVILKEHNPNRNLLTHVFLNHSRNIILTDCVINNHPDCKQKIKIANNAIKFYQDIYDEKPQIVNFLTPNGHLSEAIPESIEAFGLCAIMKERYNDIHFDMQQLDVCLSYKARAAKKMNWEKEANIIIVNSLSEGNSIYKALSLGYFNFYGYVLGADVPVVLNSRSFLDLNTDSLNLI